MAVGVLEHDDRRVDDHADAEREAAEGQRVEGVAAEVEQREGADHRDRDRRADDGRRLEVAQEQVDDRDHQQAAEQACSCTLPMARSMKRLVVEDLQLDALDVGVDALDFRLTPSAIWMVLVPDCLVTCMRMPLTPLMRMNERRSSVVSRTSAMSRM